jgi:hypothetical protein
MYDAVFFHNVISSKLQLAGLQLAGLQHHIWFYITHIYYQSYLYPFIFIKQIDIQQSDNNKYVVILHHGWAI